MISNPPEKKLLCFCLFIFTFILLTSPTSAYQICIRIYLLTFLQLLHIVIIPLALFQLYFLRHRTLIRVYIYFIMTYFNEETRALRVRRDEKSTLIHETTIIQ